MRIGLAFIFKDDKATIGAMLDSFLPHVDEVVAVDTGATDGSRGIVKKRIDRFARAGKRGILTDFKWTKDFSAARQHGWDMLEAEWGLWCDADDTLENGEGLRECVKAPVDAWVMPYDYGQAPNGVSVCELRRERLIRGPERWKWIEPVHEVLAAQFPNPQFGYAGHIVYHHHKQGKPDEAGRNLDILETALERDGDKVNPRTLIYIAQEYQGRGRHDDAIAMFDRYLDAVPWSDEKHQALHKKADSLRVLKRNDEAQDLDAYAATHAADHGVPEWADHFFGVGEAMMQKGQTIQAIPWIERGLALGKPDTMMIVNPRDYDWMPWMNLAQCYLDKARGYIVQAHQLMPTEDTYRIGRMVDAATVKRSACSAAYEYISTLIRYDENQKALEALKTLPYAVLDDPRIQELQHHLRFSLRHIHGRKGYADLYATNRETRTPDDMVEDASIRLTRVSCLVSGLRTMLGLEVPPFEIADQDTRDEVVARMIPQLVNPGTERLRLLDAGCNDGWVAAHCEKVLGLTISDGIDLNQEAIRAANARKEAYGLQGDYEQGFVEDAAEVFGEGVYDAISLFEVYEHLVDPHQSLTLLERALKPGGRMFISTPIGAYEGGMLPEWKANLEKQHLRAVTPTEFSAFALSRGTLEDMIQGVEGVQTIAYTPMERKGRIVFYAGPAWEPWSPMDMKQRGLGGSETAIAQMSTRLAALGWFVEVYAGLSASGPMGGVNYRPHWEFNPDEWSDYLFAVRAPQVADLCPNTGRMILWLHDAHYGGQITRSIGVWDDIYCLSESHATSIIEAEGVDRDHIAITRNGIDASRYPDADSTDRKRRVIYSSSPDRGLEKLLEMWPAIRQAVPDAELDVYYGFEVFDRMHALNPPMLEWKQKLLDQMESLDGVTFHGRVDQHTLAEAQQRAMVWAYPYPFGNPTETSCITAMEAMAAGMGIVVTDSAALPETVGDAGIVIKDGPNVWGDFVNAVIDLLDNEDLWVDYHDLALRRAQEFSWQALAEEWDQELEGRLIGQGDAVA